MRAEELHDELKIFLDKVYNYLSETEDSVKTTMTMPDRVDTGFFMREMEKLLEEIRKDVKARKELCGSIVAMSIAKDALNNPEKWEEFVEGRFAKALPHIKSLPKIPKRGTPEYEELCEWLKVDKELEPFISMRWSTLCDLCTELAEEGKKLPPGIRHAYTEYTTIFRRRNNRDSKE